MGLAAHDTLLPLKVKQCVESRELMGTLRFTHPTSQWQSVGWVKERSDVPIRPACCLTAPDGRNAQGVPDAQTVGLEAVITT
jgi:hypothetical protein